MSVGDLIRERRLDQLNATIDDALSGQASRRADEPGAAKALRQIWLGYVGMKQENKANALTSADIAECWWLIGKLSEIAENAKGSK